MTKMLASVSSLEEVQFMLNTAANILDLKQAKQGVLGALPIATVQQIVQHINQQKPTSATIGDLPMQADLIFNTVATLSATGVDYIKIGFFADGDGQDDWQHILLKLRHLTQQGTQLIAVLFADSPIDFNRIALFKRYGFVGVMLDTINKSSRSLSQIMSFNTLHKFVKNAHNEGLLCGLAGSLKAEDIPILLPLKSDYLGFRGALCEQHNRMATLHTESIQKVLAYF